MFPRTPQLRHAKFIIVMCDDFKNNLFQPARFHLFKTYASQALKHKWQTTQQSFSQVWNISIGHLLYITVFILML